MKIDEIVFYQDQELQHAAPVTDAMQRLANAFTRHGKVKQPLDLQGLDGEPPTLLPHTSSIAAPDEAISTVPTGDAVQDNAITPALRQADGRTVDDWMRVPSRVIDRFQR
jgi:hypothetical protein